MKTSFRKNIHNFCVLFLTGCFFFLNTGCGLDTFYYIEEPEYAKNIPSYTDETVDNHKFTFVTNEESDYSEFKFQGTEVYYKIYSRYSDTSVTSDAESEKSELDRISSDSEISSTAYETMVNRYKYKPLKLANDSGDILIPYTGKNRDVEIRLNDYGTEYKASVSVKEDGDYRLLGIPQRSFDNRTFNFAGNGDKDKLPEKDDEDVSYTNFEKDKDNVFYVVLYAVAKGSDIYFVPYHSNILYLGSVPIDASSKKQ